MDVHVLRRAVDQRVYLLPLAAANLCRARQLVRPVAAVRHRVDDRQVHAELRLVRPELGELHVHLNVGGGHIKARELRSERAAQRSRHAGARRSHRHRFDIVSVRRLDIHRHIFAAVQSAAVVYIVVHAAAERVRKARAVVQISVRAVDYDVRAVEVLRSLDKPHAHGGIGGGHIKARGGLCGNSSRGGRVDIPRRDSPAARGYSYRLERVAVGGVPLERHTVAGRNDGHAAHRALAATERAERRVSRAVAMGYRRLRAVVIVDRRCALRRLVYVVRIIHLETQVELTLVGVGIAMAVVDDELAVRRRHDKPNRISVQRQPARRAVLHQSHRPHIPARVDRYLRLDRLPSAGGVGRAVGYRRGIRRRAVYRKRGQLVLGRSVRRRRLGLAHRQVEVVAVVRLGLLGVLDGHGAGGIGGRKAEAAVAHPLDLDVVPRRRYDRRAYVVVGMADHVDIYNASRLDILGVLVDYSRSRRDQTEVVANDLVPRGGNGRRRLCDVVRNHNRVVVVEYLLAGVRRVIHAGVLQVFDKQGHRQHRFLRRRSFRQLYRYVQVLVGHRRKYRHVHRGGAVVVPAVAALLKRIASRASDRRDRVDVVPLRHNDLALKRASGGQSYDRVSVLELRARAGYVKPRGSSDDRDVGAVLVGFYLLEYDRRGRVGGRHDKGHDRALLYLNPAAYQLCLHRRAACVGHPHRHGVVIGYAVDVQPDRAAAQRLSDNIAVRRLGHLCRVLARRRCLGRSVRDHAHRGSGRRGHRLYLKRQVGRHARDIVHLDVHVVGGHLEGVHVGVPRVLGRLEAARGRSRGGRLLAHNHLPHGVFRARGGGHAHHAALARLHRLLVGGGGPAVGDRYAAYLRRGRRFGKVAVVVELQLAVQIVVRPVEDSVGGICDGRQGRQPVLEHRLVRVACRYPRAQQLDRLVRVVGQLGIGHRLGRGGIRCRAGSGIRHGARVRSEERRVLRRVRLQELGKLERRRRKRGHVRVGQAVSAGRVLAYPERHQVAGGEVIGYRRIVGRRDRSGRALGAQRRRAHYLVERLRRAVAR